MPDIDAQQFALGLTNYLVLPIQRFVVLGIFEIIR